MEVLLVLFRTGAGYEHIVYVDVDKVQPTDDLVHKALEGLTCVS